MGFVATASRAGGTFAKDTKGVGVNRDGAFAEYLCIPASNAVKVDPSHPTRRAVLL